MTLNKTTDGQVRITTGLTAHVDSDLEFNSNSLHPNSMPFLGCTCKVQNMKDLTFNLARSLKFKSDNAAELVLYNFLLLGKGKIHTNDNHSRDIRV